MNPKIDIRPVVAGLALALLPAVAFGHEIVPWGAYPAAGDVTISTKSKRLLDETFVDVLAVAPGPGGTGYEVGMGPGLPTLYGIVDFSNRKGTKAKLTVHPAALEPWAASMTSLVRQYREDKGDVVEDVAAELRSAGGVATFKTKPTPIGPLHKATVSLTIKWKGDGDARGRRHQEGCRHHERRLEGRPSGHSRRRLAAPLPARAGTADASLEDMNPTKRGRRVLSLVALTLAASASLAAAASGGAMLSGTAKLKVRGCGTERLEFSALVSFAEDGGWTALSDGDEGFAGTYTSASSSERKLELVFDAASLAGFISGVEEDVAAACETAPVTVTSSRQKTMRVVVNRKRTKAKLILRWAFEGTAGGESGKATYKLVAHGPWTEETPS